jgi:hypothetical protein
MVNGAVSRFGIERPLNVWTIALQSALSGPHPSR